MCISARHKANSRNLWICARPTVYLCSICISNMNHGKWWNKCIGAWCAVHQYALRVWVAPTENIRVFPLHLQSISAEYELKTWLALSGVIRAKISTFTLSLPIMCSKPDLLQHLKFGYLCSIFNYPCLFWNITWAKWRISCIDLRYPAYLKWRLATKNYLCQIFCAVSRETASLCSRLARNMTFANLRSSCIGARLTN